MKSVKRHIKLEHTLDGVSWSAPVSSKRKRSEFTNYISPDSDEDIQDEICVDIKDEICVDIKDDICVDFNDDICSISEGDLSDVECFRPNLKLKEVSSSFLKTLPIKKRYLLEMKSKKKNYVKKEFFEF